MIKRMLCMLLVICMLCAPALAEEDGVGLLLELTGQLVKMFDQESQPDPYLWMFEQETTNASIDDLPEIAQMLRDLGIDEITEQVEDNYRQMTEEVMLLMSQHGNEYTISREQMILGLLYTAGSEQRGENGCVYAFDAEVYESETMYRDFLKGIEHIGNGELKFDNIVEDLSGVDPETGDGARTVTFDFKGETITYEALAQHDWFDAGMLGFMHEVIGTSESGRQLYVVFDGMPGVVLFYQTPQWARAFTKATNCPLFTGM